MWYYLSLCSLETALESLAAGPDALIFVLQSVKTGDERLKLLIEQRCGGRRHIGKSKLIVFRALDERTRQSHLIEKRDTGVVVIVIVSKTSVDEDAGA